MLSSLESITTVISKGEGERKACRHERAIGSNHIRRACCTEAQMEAEREMARDELDRGDMQMIR